MDINRHNFVENFSEIQTVIKECDFIAFDTELSGLTKDRLNGLFDTIDERYAKMKCNSMDFLLIQFGLSCFKKTQNENGKTSENDCCSTYDCWTYNFYIFPYKTNNSTRQKERSFLVQSSAVAFLVSHGFDFNKLFAEGINWLTIEEEKHFLESLENNFQINDDEREPKGDIDIYSNSKYPTIPSEHKDFINEALIKVNNFLRNDRQQTIHLSVSSPYQRKLLYEIFKASQYNNSLDVSTSKNFRDRHMIINKITREEKEKQRKQLITETVGFSRIIQCIVASRKPVVGHNLLLDLMHTVRQFLHPLPNTFSEFQAMIKDLFPNLFDTKFIASFEKFKEMFQNTSLEEVHNVVKKEPFKPIEVKNVNLSGDTNSNCALHQAGYDSFITGYSFAVFTDYFKSEIETFKNKLPITCIHDISHLSIDASNETPDRNHVFHVSFLSSWKTNDIIQLFSAFGQVVIAWINDTSAFVALKNVSKAVDAVKAFQQSKSSNFQVQTYAEFCASKSNGAIKRKEMQITSDNYVIDITPSKKIKSESRVESKEAETI
ncbi:poly(A)-specific ribonuclease PARN-like isoform X1 [Dinothrombium tinctorium]|uniref:Poly(A)-specific ribonuclease PARN-like isoform X1 n=1 Tax=Dinothrombium tinctorium TaxID=1965070 RepID=A0A3S3S148_9ACAR|nr:poly(A)-specific ribonuclease PARN-like isoform X1 [Dinothrombium tinctorium]